MSDPQTRLVIKKSPSARIFLAILLGASAIGAVSEENWGALIMALLILMALLISILLIDNRIMNLDGNDGKITIRIDGGSEIEFRISDIERFTFKGEQLYVQAGGTCFVHGGLGMGFSTKDQDRVIAFLTSMTAKVP